jgi:hypothetical protein
LNPYANYGASTSRRKGRPSGSQRTESTSTDEVSIPVATPRFGVANTVANDEERIRREIDRLQSMLDATRPAPLRRVK